MHERQDYVVLIACSGVYWACMFADRNTVMDQVVGKPADDFQPELDNSNDLSQVSLDDEDDMGENLGDVLLKLEEDIDELDLIDQPDDPTANVVNANDEKLDTHSSSSISEEEPVVPDAEDESACKTCGRYQKCRQCGSRVKRENICVGLMARGGNGG
jgi:hypothetical protein